MVASSDNCLSTTAYACMARRGGVYNPSLSTTDNELHRDRWWTKIDNYDAANFDFHNDVLTFGNDTQVWGWPSCYRRQQGLVGKSLSLLANFLTTGFNKVNQQLETGWELVAILAF